MAIDKIWVLAEAGDAVLGQGVAVARGQHDRHADAAIADRLRLLHRVGHRPGGFFDQGRGTAAIGALQVFEYHNGNLRALRRTQGGIHRLLRPGAQRSREDESNGY